jgi:transcriptional regulator with XRE-family HTH domain
MDSRMDLRTNEVTTSVATLRMLMAAQGFRSFRTLCLSTGIHQGTLGALLHGRRRPSKRTINTLAAALHLDPKFVRELIEGARSQ